MNTQPVESPEEVSAPATESITLAEPYIKSDDSDETDIEESEKKGRSVPEEEKKTVRNCAAYLAAKFAPLVFYGGKFHWAVEGVWQEIDGQIIREAHNLCPQGGKNVIDSLAQSMRLRQDTIYTNVCATTNTKDSLLVRHLPEYLSSSEIMFANGKLDLNAKKFYENRQDTKQMDDKGEFPHMFGPHITLPYNEKEPRSRFFESYIKQIFPDDEYRKFFQRLMGTIIAPHNSFRGYFVFYGPAKTGKSSLATALAYAPAGTYGYETKTEYSLSHDKFEAISLANKFVNVSNDSSPTPRWENWLKQYTSGRISVQAKFRDSESIIPTAKLITTCNSLNAFENIAHSFDTRFFPFKFTIPVPDTGAADSTKFLSETFWKGHREGIIYWLLEGYRDFLAKGLGKDIPATWLRDKKEMLDDSNPLEDWLSDNLVKKENTFLPCDELFAQVPVEFLKKAPQANRLAIYNSISSVFGLEKTRSGAAETRGKYGFQGLTMKGKTNNA